MKYLCFILLLIGCSLAETDQDAYSEHDPVLYNYPVRGGALRGFGQSPVAPTTAAPQASYEPSVKENEANFSDGRVYLTKKLLLLKKFFAGGTPKVITIDKPVPIPIPVPHSESSAVVSNNGGAAATGTVTATAAETGTNANTGDGGTGAEEDETEHNAPILAGRRRTPVRYAYRNVYEEDEEDEELDDDELGREQDDDSDNELEDDEDDSEEDDEDYDDEALIIEEKPVGRGDSAHRILIARQNRPIRPIRRRRPDPNDPDRFDVDKRRATLPPLPPLEYEDDFPNPPPRKNKRRRPQNRPVQNIQPQQPAAQEEAEEEPEAQGGVIHGISQALGLGNLANGLVGGNSANSNNNKGDTNKVGVNRVGANNGGGNRRGGNRRGGNRRGQVGFGQGQGGFVQGGGGGGQGGFAQGGGGGRPQRQRKPQRKRQQGNRRRFVGTNNGNLRFKGNNKNRRRKFQTGIGANGQPLDTVGPLE